MLPLPFNPQIAFKALSFFSDGNLSRLPQLVQYRLAQAAREVDLDRLPDAGPASARNEGWNR